MRSPSSPTTLPCFLPGLSVFADQAHEGLHLGLGDVLLQQFAVVVQQSSDGVLGQDVITDLTLHHTKLLGNVLLQKQAGRQKERKEKRAN